MARSKKDKTSVATSATSATQAVNESGIPDWRDPAAYGDTSQWSFNRWRWEFYRRRDDIRSYYDANIEDQTKNFPGLIKFDPDEFPKAVFVEKYKQMELGYISFPDPRTGDHPNFCINQFAKENHVRFLKKEQVKLASGFSDSFISDHEIVFVFNIHLSVNSQIEECRKMLSYLQDQLHENKKPRKQNAEGKQRLLYLRTLDAREAGATWREIAIALLPMRKDEAGEEVHAREQKARDVWNAANKLRFNF